MATTWAKGIPFHFPKNHDDDVTTSIPLTQKKNYSRCRAHLFIYPCSHAYKVIVKARPKRQHSTIPKLILSRSRTRVQGKNLSGFQTQCAYIDAEQRKRGSNGVINSFFVSSYDTIYYFTYTIKTYIHTSSPKKKTIKNQKARNQITGHRNNIDTPNSKSAK
jgi:hypothetical protein